MQPERRRPSTALRKVFGINAEIGNQRRGGNGQCWWAACNKQGVRIALPTTTTTTGSTNPLLTQSQPTGASFLSVLFGTSGTSTQGAGVRGSNPDAQSNTQTTSGQQLGSIETAPQATSQQPMQGQIAAGLTALLMDAAGVSGAGQTVPRFQTVASTANPATNVTNNKDQKAQSDSASTAATAVPVVATPVPQQILQIPVPAAQPVEAQSTDQSANENDPQSRTAPVDAAPAAQSAVLQGAELAAVESRNQPAIQTRTVADAQTSRNPEAQQPASSDAGASSATSANQDAGQTQTAQTQAMQGSTTAAVLPQGPMFLNNIFAANPSFFASASNGTQSTTQSGAAKFGDAAQTKDPASTNGNSNVVRTSNSADNSPAAAGNTTQGSQGGAATQHGQTDASQTVAATAATKPTDATPLQTMTVQVAAPQSTTAGVATGATHHADAAPATVSAQVEAGDGTASSGVNTARVIQSMSESEMRVGMRSTEFGDISIRTAVSQQQMVTQITVDHGDLGRAIALHAPAAQTKLGDDFGLHASIEVTQSGTGFTGERGNTPQQQQRFFAGTVQADTAMPSAETESMSSRALAGTADADRLDIRA